jgi:hypothetical protein
MRTQYHYLFNEIDITYVLNFLRTICKVLPINQNTNFYPICVQSMREIWLI